MKVGVLGYGEAGAAIAAGLTTEGVDVLAFDIRFAAQGSESLREQADRDGVTLVAKAGDLCRADVIFSLVTADSALEAARSLATCIGPRHIVADLNSVSPRLARRIHDLLAPTGAATVDVAVMGAVTGRRHKVQMLAAGPGASALAHRLPMMNIEVLDGEPGDASAIKMLRSLLMKGLQALFLEFSLVADRSNAGERVLASLDETLPFGTWQELADYMLGRTALHGERLASELREAAAMSAELGIEPIVAEAGAQRLERAARPVASEGDGDSLPFPREDAMRT